MDKKKQGALQGAMVVAASIGVGTDAVASPAPADDDSVLRMTDTGLQADAVRLDADVRRLQQGAVHGAGVIDGDGIRLAQTIFSGSGDDGRRGVRERPKRGRESLAVTNPVTKSSMFVTFDWITGLFFDPATNEEIDPPDWVREEVEKLAE